MAGDLTLGRLSLREVDQPFFFCQFTPSVDFAQVAPVFARDAAAIEGHDQVAQEDAGEAMDELGLRLVHESDGSIIEELLIHVSGNEAWFRY